MYSHVRLPIQPSLILTRVHFVAHGSLLIAYLTLPISAWPYLFPLVIVQLNYFLKLKRKQFLFQTQRLLELEPASASLTIHTRRPISIYNLYASAVWPAFVILRYQSDQAHNGWMWIHQSQTNAEAFRKLKVMATIGQLEKENKRTLQ